MRVVLGPLLAGLVFAVGLGVSGMTQPAKVIGFLDVLTDFDPSLAFVMIGAIAVHLGCSRLVMRRATPLFEPRFHVPSRRDVDAPLAVGAVLFGLGWGLCGVCPGPAVVGLASGATPFLVFAVAMLGGMALHALAQRVRARADDG